MTCRLLSIEIKVEERGCGVILAAIYDSVQITLLSIGFATSFELSVDQELEQETFSMSTISEVSRKLVSFATDTKYTKWLCPLLVAADTALCAVIILKVPCKSLAAVLHYMVFD
jgi:hypothetical protein